MKTYFETPRLVIAAVIVCVIVVVAVVWLCAIRRTQPQLAVGRTLPCIRPLSLLHEPNDLYWRWVETGTRHKLATTVITADLLNANHARDADPARFVAVVDQVPVEFSACFDLVAGTVSSPGGSEWARSDGVLQYEDGPPACYPPFEGLAGNRDTHFLPKSQEWRATLEGRVLAATAVFSYGGKEFVVVESAPDPSGGNMKDASDRHGPYVLQVFDASRHQIGPTIGFADVRSETKLIRLSVLSDDPVIICFDGSIEGRWWIVDFKPYLDEELSR